MIYLIFIASFLTNPHFPIQHPPPLIPPNMTQQIYIQMQEQIQIQEEAQLQDLNNIINRPPTPHQEYIQQHITEHYLEDFDSVSGSQGGRGVEADIQEEYYFDSYNQGQGGEEYWGIGCQQLQRECGVLMGRIGEIQRQLEGKELQQQDECKAIVEAINSNQQIINTFEQQKLACIHNILGRNNFCSELLLNQSQNTQEKLLQQTQKLKASIATTELQISKLVRQTKKYEQLLPELQNKQEQLYRKCKQIKRELQEKNNKFDLHSKKEEELNNKILQLKQKMVSLVSQGRERQMKSSFMDVQQLENTYRRCVKDRESCRKRNSLISHQYDNSSLGIAKNIVQLKLQYEEMSQKIDKLQQKNVSLQEQSQILMQRYLRRKEKKQVKTTTMDHDSKDVSQQRENAQENQYITHINSDRGKNERYCSTPKKKNHSVVNQSSITSTVTNLKQFKLKLPSNTHKKSQKNLNQAKNLQISLDLLIEAHPMMPSITKQPKKMISLEKLTISQRIQKIQHLERQDRIFSSKLYDKIDQLRQETKLEFHKDTTKTQQKPQSTKKDLAKRQSNVSACNSSVILDKEEKIRLSSVNMKSYESFNIHSEADMPNYRKAYLINRRHQSLKKDEEININLKLNNLEEIKESDKTFDQTPNQSMLGSQDVLNTSCLSVSSNNKFFKKRMINREKKISEDYMKILQQRGRKILQLDNENEQ